MLFTVSVNAYSQDLQKINAKAKFKDFCFSDKIATVKLFKTGNPLADPIITLNSGETVTLIFDEFIDDNNDVMGNYCYTIEHRDADWREEGLIINDYMSGFSENEFEIIRHSQGTAVMYRNFFLTLPNSSVNLKISGNYLIKVFERRTQQLVLIKGFSVIEPLTAVNASMQPPTNRLCTQQLNFTVEHPTLKIPDVYMNLKVRIEQNSIRVPNSKDPLPAFVKPGSIDYTRPDKNTYGGQNEFRSFDTRALNYSGQGIAGRTNGDIQKVDLVHDMEHSEYVPISDINGKYIIASDRAVNPDIQSDYIKVGFSFASKSHLEGRVFLFGELTNWSISEKYEMRYINRSYKCEALLKQGFYNYQYIVVNHKGDLDISATEGCFYDTENTYNIYVYFRAPENRYDKLVGFQRVISKR
jgi:hypothetical protein